MNSAEGYLVSSPAAEATSSGQRLRVRLAEAFFRRWPLIILPVLLLGAFGVYQATKVPKVYRSVGTINVASSTAISDITSINAPNFGWDTPASKTAREMNQLLGTAAFANSVAKNAQLSEAVASGQIGVGDVRQYVYAVAGGDNLLSVVGSSPYPELSLRLANALITSYRDHVVSNETAGLTGAISFLDTEMSNAQDRLDDANAAVDSFLTDHPGPATTRTETEELQFQRLTAAVSSAQTQVSSLQASLDEANLSIKQSQSDIDQRLQIVDEPQAPYAPMPIRMEQLSQIAIFVFIGLAVAVAATMVMALLDHSVRTSADIAGISGLRVIGAIPNHAPGGKSPRRRGTVPLLAGPTPHGST